MPGPHPLLFLIGYRGSGKTTAARLLAEHLGWTWCDADALLEERAGRSIREIFAAEGELGFRDREAQILAELANRRQMVVATGGGVVMREANRTHLRTGLVVWLTAEVKVLFARTQLDATTGERRPPLAQGGLAEIQDILEKRHPLYEQCANLVVDTANLSPEEVVAAILNHPAYSAAILGKG